MSDIWTPEEGSDALLRADPIAAAKVMDPHSSPELTEAGIVLPDLDDDANEELAALALAELDGDDPVGEVESGAVDDDDEIDDDTDTDPIGDEV